MAIVIPVISTFDNKGVTKAIQSFKALDGAGQKSAFALLNTTKSLNSFGKSIAKFGAVTAGIGALIGGSLARAGLEGQKVFRQTEAIITATGGAANLTAQQVTKLSQSLALQTGVDDDLVQGSLNLLLTFKQVRNEVGKNNDIFNRASMATLDLGNVFGSTDAAAKMLGKALSDPTKGVTALARAGVNFSKQQREQIKTLVESGKTLEAQKLILTEVESQVGGTAIATATGFDKMKVAFALAQESLEDALMPILETVSNFVTDNLVPVFKEFSDIVGEQGLGAGFKFLGEQGLDALGKLNGWGTVIYTVVAGMIALNVATGIYTISMGIATIATATFGVTLNVAFAGIPALIGLAVIAITALALKFEGFRSALGTFAEFFGRYVINPIIKGLNFIVEAINGIPFVGNLAKIPELKFGVDKKSMKEVGFLKNQIDNAKKAASNIPPIKVPGAGKDLKETGKGLDKAKIAADKLKKAITDLRREIKDGMEKALEDANAKLEEATKAFDDFASGISSALMAGFSFADAYTKRQEEIASNSDELTKALEDQKKAQLEFDKVMARGLPSINGVTFETEELIQARFDLAEATRAVNTAQAKTPLSFWDNLNSQVAKVKNFGVLLNRLLAANASPETYQAVVDAGVDVGTGIAEELLATEGGVLRANDLFAEMKKFSENVALNGAKQFKQVGVDLGTALVTGVKEAIAALDTVLANPKASLSDLEAGYDKFKNTVTGLNTAVNAGTTPTTGTPAFDFSGIDLSNLFLDLNLGDIVGGLATLGEGGIVTKPTLALIGEAGESEAVIPLSRLGNMGGATNVTINVQGGDPQSVVDALRTYMFRNGSVPIRVSG
jgi:hypothetical protein